MIADKIKHQSGVLAQVVHVLPVTTLGVNLVIVNDGETVIGRPGKKATDEPD